MNVLEANMKHMTMSELDIRNLLKPHDPPETTPDPAAREEVK